MTIKLDMCMENKDTLSISVVRLFPIGHCDFKSARPLMRFVSVHHNVGITPTFSI